jgi:hypothetical protein
LVFDYIVQDKKLAGINLNFFYYSNSPFFLPNHIHLPIFNSSFLEYSSLLTPPGISRLLLMMFGEMLMKIYEDSTRAVGGK